MRDRDQQQMAERKRAIIEECHAMRIAKYDKGFFRPCDNCAEFAGFGGAARKSCVGHQQNF
jgi:hypothetical protein